MDKKFILFVIPILIMGVLFLYIRSKKIKEDREKVKYKMIAIGTYCYTMSFFIFYILSFWGKKTKENLLNIIVFGVTAVLLTYIYFKLKNLMNKSVENKTIDKIIYIVIIIEIILYLV